MEMQKFIIVDWPAIHAWLSTQSRLLVRVPALQVGGLQSPGVTWLSR